MPSAFIRARRPAAWGRAGVLLTVAAGAMLTSVPARGDNIDERLIKEAPRILRYLREHGLTTVGVLRFRVKKGAEGPTFAAGPMNSNMVTRLENVLAVACDDGKGTLQLLADPGQTIAAQGATLTYLNERGRAALFRLEYQAIGKSEPVRADAFLFGTVALSEDYATTSVTLSAFTAARLWPETVAEFSVPTDRDILSDIGQNFIITKRDGKRSLDRDKIAIRSWKPYTGVQEEKPTGNGQQANGNGSKPPGNGSTPGGGGTLVPDLKDYVDFKILYGGQEQPIGLDAKKGNWQITPPREGQSVEMMIKNVTDKRIAVVLMINGLNTIMSKKGSIYDEQPKYVLDPKEEYRIKGFLQKDQKMAPFSVVPVEKLGSEMMSPAEIGMIQLAVFDQGPIKEFKISTHRGTIPDGRVRPRSLRDVQQRSGLTRGSDGVIRPDTSATVTAHWTPVDFENPSQVGNRSIIYLEGQAAKGGPDAK